MNKKVCFEISEELIREVVNELNELEYDGKLSYELVVNNDKLFNYIFRREVISYLYDIEECWNEDMFCDIKDIIEEQLCGVVDNFDGENLNVNIDLDEEFGEYKKK